VAREPAFSTEALSELEDASTWYELRADGLGAAFRAAVEHTIEGVLEAPFAGPRVAGSAELRRVIVAGFPYMLLYAVDDDFVRFAVVAHMRRRPGYWHR